jgi:hypothetical protein
LFAAAVIGRTNVLHDLAFDGPTHSFAGRKTAPEAIKSERKEHKVFILQKSSEEAQ